MSGKKFDSDKVPLDLIPMESLFEIGKVLAAGAKKYERANWANGIEMSRLISAAMRHLLQFNNGEDIDEECQTLHLANSAVNLIFAIWMYKNRPDMDDRWIKKIKKQFKFEASDKWYKEAAELEVKKACENIEKGFSEISSRSLEDDMDSNYIPSNDLKLFDNDFYVKQYLTSLDKAQKQMNDMGAKYIPKKSPTTPETILESHKEFSESVTQAYNTSNVDVNTDDDLHTWRKEPLYTEKDIEMMKKQAADNLKLFTKTYDDNGSEELFKDDNSPYAKVARGITKFNKEKT